LSWRRWCSLLVAYRGFSVISSSPIAAGRRAPHRSVAGAAHVTSLFMDKMVGFIKLYFPVFLLGAVFGRWSSCPASRSPSFPQ
jgi:H+/gluconate symporter-like permease